MIWCPLCNTVPDKPSLRFVNGDIRRSCACGVLLKDPDWVAFGTSHPGPRLMRSDGVTKFRDSSPDQEWTSVPDSTTVERLVEQIAVHLTVSGVMDS